MPKAQCADRVTQASDGGGAPPASAAIAVAAPAAGETPLEYILRVMRNPGVEDDRRDGMAKAALPYMHARLSSSDGQIFDNKSGTITFTWLPTQN